jgi:hypothetical protein
VLAGRRLFFPKKLGSGVGGNFTEELKYKLNLGSMQYKWTEKKYIYFTRYPYQMTTGSRTQCCLSPVRRAHLKNNITKK